MSDSAVANLKFFSECTVEEQLAILESARISLQDENVLSHMDLGAVLAVPLVDRLIDFLGEPPKPEGFKIVKPCISVSRSSKVIAVFDDYKVVRDFRPYLDETKAIDAAKAWIKQYTDVAPDVVFPVVTRMTMSTGRRKR